MEIISLWKKSYYFGSVADVLRSVDPFVNFGLAGTDADVGLDGGLNTFMFT